MRLLIGTIILIVVASGLARGQAASVEEEVLKRDEELRAALLRGDAAALESIYAEDFNSTGASGRVKSKGQSIGALKSGAVRYETITAEEVSVRAHGGAATLSALWKTSGTRGDGRRFRAESRVTRVYVKRQGAWRLQGQQSTHVEKAGRPPEAEGQPPAEESLLLISDGGAGGLPQPELIEEQPGVRREIPLTGGKVVVPSERTPAEP